jgi:hypothetical protein
VKKIILPIITITLLSGCSKNPEEIIAACLENAEHTQSRNLNGDLDGVQQAINHSTRLGSCLASELELDSHESDASKAQTILDFVSKNIAYKVDETGTKTPAKTLNDKEGDCEDFTALTGTILRAAHVDFYLIDRPPFEESELGHVYVGIESKERTGMECDGKHLSIVDATDTAATVGVESYEREYEFTCRLIKN